ncbi:MAG: serine/threonine protein kinase [Bdellovibrionales bacterium]|nr:serine/threonine protein kinase [Bdellovibrionales bacterium]
MDSTESQNLDALGDELAAGSLIAGRYEIVKPLGTGGMGSVYLARDRILGSEEVAVKILHRQFAYDTKYTQRFLREVQLMRRVNHNNVIRTYDVGADGDIVYFSMELIRGTSLLSVMENGSLSIDQLLDLVVQICEGLEAIHNANIIHRDLKPENVMYLRDGSIKIADFGVARPEQSQLTEHNEVIGSAAYMAPEIWLGEGISSKIDLYSLGIIMYELFSGVLPFDAETPALAMRMHLDRTPTPPNQHNPELPRWLNRLILRLLEKSPNHRPTSAREIIEYIKNSRERSKKAGKNGMSSSHAFLKQLEATTRKATDDAPTATARRGSSKMRRPLSFSFLKKRPRAVHKIKKRKEVKVSTEKHFDAKMVLRSGLTALLAGALLLGAGALVAHWSGFDYQTVKEDGKTIVTILAPDVNSGGELSEVLWGIFGPAMLFIMLLTLPGTMLGALGGSLRRSFGAWTYFCGFYLCLGVALYLYHLYPIIERWKFDGPSMLAAAQAVRTQLGEFASLLPQITSFTATVLSSTIMLEAGDSQSIINNAIWFGIFAVHIWIIVVIARRALGRTCKNPEKIYVILPTAVGTLLGLALYSDKAKLILESLSFSQLELGSYVLKLPVTIPGTGLACWSLVLLCVWLLVPAVGGTRSKNDI